MSWVALHVHSQYSILDSTASVDSIAKAAAASGMPAVALTDHGNLYGAVEFFKACSASNIKPIIGCELYVAPNSRLEKKREGGQRTSYHLTLLAKNNTGYHNLCKLSSSGFLEGYYYNPRIDEALLEQHSEGLICLSGCMHSKVAHEALNGTPESLEKTVLWYRQIFGEDYYLELMRHPMTEEQLQSDGMYQESWLFQQYQDRFAKQEKLNEILIQLSKKHGIPLVATNDTHYIDREDWRAHEILINVQSGEPCEILEKDSYGNIKSRKPNPKRSTYPSHALDFKSPEAMGELFHDLPEALSNTLVIAEKCNVKIDFKTKHYPVYHPPETPENPTKEQQSAAVEAYLWKLCEEGISKRYHSERLAKVAEIYPGRDPMVTIRERLAYEMDIIVPKGMADYLLIVWDFIHWAKSNDIPVGPGRGSGAGSIVLYLIGITDIEPLRFHLFFERFINPERLSYPDIDVDICMERRGEVINYTLGKYGKENVAQIITFGTMKAKMAIKDVGRVLDVPLSKVNGIAKLIPDDLNITIEKALEKDPDLLAMYQSDTDARRIIDLALKLEGSIRNTGIHAAGIIIAGAPLTQFIPVCNAKDSEMPVTQYSMKPVEQVGMLKVDFLGLKTLTAIQMTVDAVKKRLGVHIDWVDLPLDDKPTFDLLNQGQTLGIFQLESGGMQDLARNLHLDKFEEIIAVGALYRPGPMDMIPSFINRKHGREPIEYEHPWMQDILSETYGIMVYQEQVMQIASKLAKYSLGEGDVLRRAMGKKDMEQMAKEREKFREGASSNGISEEVSMSIFDKMEKFASYGFNKSHAAAYGYLSYVTAYLKANYPTEWMAALMTCDSSDLTKVAKFIRECHGMGIAMLPPDVNEAGTTFVATSKGIRFALSGIKGIGTGVVEAIIQERDRGGHFKSFYQFLKRIDTKKVGKKTIECLADAGSFDFTGWSRDALRENLDSMYDSAAKEQSDHARGFMSLFAAEESLNEGRFTIQPEVRIKSSRQEALYREKNLLGFFLAGHPLDDYKNLLYRLSCVSLNEIQDAEHDFVCRAAFLVESVQVRISAKSQKKFAILVISDGMENYELPIWSELYEEKGELLLENRMLLAVLQVDKKSESTRLSCKWLADLSTVDEVLAEACDQAYDKAKHQVARYAAMKARNQDDKPKMNKESSEEANRKAVASKPKSSQLKIRLDADKMRLSHVLNLKDLVAEHRGTTSVQLEFETGGRQIASIDIASQWGVQLKPELEKRLREQLPLTLYEVIT